MQRYRQHNGSATHPRNAKGEDDATGKLQQRKGNAARRDGNLIIIEQERNPNSNGNATNTHANQRKDNARETATQRTGGQRNGNTTTMQEERNVAESNLTPTQRNTDRNTTQQECNAKKTTGGPPENNATELTGNASQQETGRCVPPLRPHCLPIASPSRFRCVTRRAVVNLHCNLLLLCAVVACGHCCAALLVRCVIVALFSC
jgi:hypothetical protein